MTTWPACVFQAESTLSARSVISQHCRQPYRFLPPRMFSITFCMLALRIPTYVSGCSRRGIVPLLPLKQQSSPCYRGNNNRPLVTAETTIVPLLPRKQQSSPCYRGNNNRPLVTAETTPSYTRLTP